MNWYFFVVYTEPVIESCTDCDRDFRTYVPDPFCCLPDGGTVTYKDPQLSCPMCDPSGYGGFMNYDLFPELIRPDLSHEDNQMSWWIVVCQEHLFNMHNWVGFL